METSTLLDRRAMLISTLATVASTSAAPPQRLLIDTHLEVWTLDPKFPFNHPEAGRNLKVEMAAPIENQVEQMRDFGLKYAVLINPRYFGWDNSYIAHSLKSYEDTWPFYKAIYEEFGGKQLVWGTGYPRPRWELPMDKELEFVDKFCDFYSNADRELMLGKNALRIWKFPSA